jgi:hypothetical protein
METIIQISAVILLLVFIILLIRFLSVIKKEQNKPLKISVDVNKDEENKLRCTIREAILLLRGVDVCGMSILPEHGWMHTSELIVEARKVYDERKEVENNPIGLDSKCLRTILKLKEENVLMKRAINEACVMLVGRKRHTSIEYNGADLHLISCIRNFLDDLDKEKNPADDTSKSNASAD